MTREDVGGRPAAGAAAIQPGGDMVDASAATAANGHVLDVAGDAGTASRRGMRTWAALTSVWLTLGLLESAKAYLAAGSRGEPRSWPWVLAANMPWWLCWALLTPIAFAVARRWPLGGPRRLVAFLMHGAAAFVCTMAHLVSTGILLHWLTRDRFTMAATGRIAAYAANFVVIDLVIYAAIVGAWFALDYARRWRASALDAATHEARAARLELGLVDARLQALRMELNPHFLFNTLNAIAGLVRRQENAAAVGMLARLGDLLRVTLDRDLAQEISLDDELALLQTYLDIEQSRFGSRLVIEQRIDLETRRALVPTLLLQPIVENAVRHGVALLAGPGRIELSASQQGASLLIAIRDTGRGLLATAPREGIGISNTRARLAHLYGDAASLRLENAPGGGARAVLELPLRLARREAHVVANA